MMLPIIGISTLFLRHRHLPKEIAPSPWVTAFLWFATIVIICLTGYYVINQITK
jgi:hypothetical protein